MPELSATPTTTGDAVSAPELAATDQPNPATSPARRKTGTDFWAKYTLGLVLVLVCLLFSVLKPETFPTYVNATAILSSQTVLLVLALAALFPLVAGEFDLSVGYTLGFSAMLLAVLTAEDGVPVPVAVFLAIAVGGVMGAVNAFLIITLRVNAFIATLASGTVLQGLTLWVSEGRVIAGLPESIPNVGRTQIWDMPIFVPCAAVAALIIGFVLERTPVGRYLYATGSGREAARLAGVRTNWLLALAFIVSGLFSGIAGVMQTAILGAANPDVGAQYLLPVFAAGFLGATAIRPGRFNVGGTVLALLLLAVGIAGLSQLGAPLWVSPVFNGLALIVAVALAVKRRDSLSAT